MIIDSNKKFVFVAIAKTACTSIHRRLGYFIDPVPSIYHMSIQDAISQFPEIKTYFKFAFVRNPYDRLISAFFDFRYNLGHQRWAYPIYKYDTFKDFVLDLNNSPCKNFIHLRSQFDYLSYNNVLLMDYVGKFESLQTDFYKLESILNLDHVPLNIHRESQHDHYEKYYDQQTKDIVYNFYRKDFEIFEYEE